MSDPIAVGVDVGGTHAKLALMTFEGRVVAEGRIDSGIGSTSERLGPRLADAIGTLLADADARRDEVRALGLVSPGFVDETRTRTLFSPNTPGLLGGDLPRHLSAAMGLPVTFDSDVNGAVFGEATWGAGRGAGRFFTLTLGTGVGGAFTVDGRVVRIAGGAIGDIGHILLEPGGRRCTAGCAGCAEGLLGAAGMAALAHRMGAPASVDGPAQIVRALEAGHAWALDTAAEAGRHVGVLLASIMAILLPDRIAIVGGTSMLGEPFLEAVRTTVVRVGGAPYVEGRAIVQGDHPTLAGAVGAAALACEEVMAGSHP